MYCNKVKRESIALLYATTESYKIKLETQFACKEDIPILSGENSPMSWLFYSLHKYALPHSETGICGSDDSLWHGSK